MENVGSVGWESFGQRKGFFFRVRSAREKGFGFRLTQEKDLVLVLRDGGVIGLGRKPVWLSHVL